MRIESSVTSISWIPSEAVTGMTKLPFEVGVTHYDNPPPDVVDDLEGLGAADGFRFANRLRAWIEVENGKIVDHAYAGGAVMGSTTVRLGKQATFQAIGFPELQREPEVTPTSVRFVQTAGGRPAIPAPRRVRHPPFVQLKGPTVWSTLGLTIGVDGTARFDLVGASPFPASPSPGTLRIRRPPLERGRPARRSSRGARSPMRSTSRGRFPAVGSRRHR